MNPIHIPDDWADSGLVMFEEFCELVRTPRTESDWRCRGVGPRWARFNGCGLATYITVGEARRFLGSVAARTDRLTEHPLQERPHD
jgi:hypothetical protein